MIKEFLMRKLLERQTKHLPKAEQEMILTMLKEDPKLFETIAKEMQDEMKKGKGQMSAAMAVLPKYKERLQTLREKAK